MGSVKIGQPFVLATLTTRNFEFEALGNVREDCEIALHEAWEVHCRDYPDAAMDFMRNAIEDGEVQFHEITLGGVLRDGETLL